MRHSVPIDERRESEEGGRTVLAVAGGTVALLAGALLAAGAALLWLGDQRDSDGFFTTGPHSFESPTFAISSDNLEVVADAPRWLFDQDRIGTVRIRVDETERPLFVGIAPARDVDRYLSDVPHEIATGVGTDPFGVDYRQAIGTQPPQAPGAETFWVASSAVRGDGELAWEVEPGRWSVVVMNADGSAGIAANLELGAKVGFLVPFGVGLTVGGVLLLLLGLAGVVFGLLMRPGPPPAHGPPRAGVPEHELETVSGPGRR